MFKNKTDQQLNNICGKIVATLRVAHTPPLSQRLLADNLQLLGLDIDKNAVQRIECGKRFVTDIELSIIATFFHVTTDYLLGRSDKFKDL